MYGSYDKGDVVRVSVAFTVSGVATDPSTVTLKVKTPDGVTTTWTVTPGQVVDDAGIGAFHADWPVAQSGPHYYRWEGTGACIAAEEAYFFGRATVF